MNFDTLALVALVLAAIPCGLFLLNLLVYRRLPRARSADFQSAVSQVSNLHDARRFDTPPNLLSAADCKSAIQQIGNLRYGVSVLIPARNEETNIRATLAAVLANRGAEFEVVVLDDHSTDGTASIVSGFAARDPRVRLESAPPLPAGWCGKQHACHVLARLARHPLLVFIDADVRLAPDALARMGGFMERDTVLDCGSPPPLSDAPGPSKSASRRRAAQAGGLAHSKTLRSSSSLVNRKSPFVNPPALASGVPRQELGTFSERLLLPLIHFVLLGYLPMHAMRKTRWPSMSAGCGQLFIARRDAYQQCGGHAMLRDSLHDGIKLPRVFRRAGFRTDLFDATDLATCRMYHTNGETWRGLGKNATEGLAAPGTIVPMTALLLGGQVLPFILLALAPLLSSGALVLSGIAALLAYLPRLVAATLFRQSLGSALLHPFGVLALLAIQWHALARHLLGRPAEWKGRSYGAVAAPHPIKAA